MLIETSPTISWVSADHWPTISRSWADFPSTIGRLIDQCNDITSILFQVGLNSGNTNKMFGACDTAKSLPSSVVNSEREVLRKKLFKVAAKGDLQELDNLLVQQVSFGVQDFDKRTPLWVKQKLNLMFCKLTEIVLFNHSPAGGKKQTSRRDPRLFSYMIPMISIVTFLVKKYLENKSFSRGFMFLLVECMQFLIKLRRLSYFDLLNCFVVTWPACVVISTV